MTQTTAIEILSKVFNTSYDGTFIAPWTYGDQCGDVYHQFGIKVVNDNQLIALANSYSQKEVN